MIFNQSEFDICCEWDEQGIYALAPISDVVIIVDVMSFSTCVSIAVSRGAEVIPYPRNDVANKYEYAKSIHAEVAESRGCGKYSLSPASLINIPTGTKLLLPSPNGSKLSLATGTTPTIAGCLRNAKAVAQAAQQFGKKIAVIPVGERWKSDNSLRPAIEDWIGAGAIIQHLTGTFSPEAMAAVSVYTSVSENMRNILTECSSGKELIAMGYESDIGLIAEMDVDSVVPILKDGRYVREVGVGG